MRQNFSGKGAVPNERRVLKQLWVKIRHATRYSGLANFYLKKPLKTRKIVENCLKTLDLKAKII